ncbi:hypothetical protein TrVE_jg3062 [Triparma verrucosa]|uniref:Uncharacterized protein n=1 Tax=Triparma verrucosa TaxID=1606542 RepID=A0A9W6Z7G9_9STRA|nr:hypothetical protein TrVE_jg3062 [Triparma verrucosa]
MRPTQYAVLPFAPVQPSVSLTLSTQESTSGGKPNVDSEYVNELQLEISDLLGRLKRRNLVIDAIRKAYLKDVVTIKHQIMLSKKDPNFDPENTELKHRLPSLDMRPTLDLFAPAECSLKVKPCDGCGGSLEIIHRESKRVAALTKSCTELQKIEQECRLKASRMEVQANKDRRALEELKERSAADKEVFLRQIAQLKAQLAEVDLESFERMRKALAEMAKEMATNNDKMSAYNMLKDQMDEMSREQDELRKRMEDSVIQIREMERLRAEAVQEMEAAKRRIAEMDEMLKKHEEENARHEKENARLNEELRLAAEKNARIQQLLDESRKNEAYLKQKISAMEAEFNDNMEREQQNQEELQNQIEAMRDKMRAAKKEADKSVKQLKEYKENSESGTAELVATKLSIAEEKAKEEFDKMQKEYEGVIENLRKELVVAKNDHEVAVKEGESKLKASESMRLEVEQAHEGLKEEKRGLTRQLTDMEGQIGAHQETIDGLSSQVAEQRSGRVDSLAANLALKAKLVGGDGSGSSSKEEVKGGEEVKEDPPQEGKENDRRASTVNFDLEQNEVESIDKIDERVHMKIEMDKMKEEMDALREQLEISQRAQELTKLQIVQQQQSGTTKEDEEGEEEEKKEEIKEEAAPTTDADVPTAEASDVMATQLEHLMQIVKEHKLQEEAHKLELEKAAFEKAELEKLHEEQKEEKNLVKQKSEKLEIQIREMGDTLSKQNMQIDMFEAQMKEKIDNSDDPEAARKAVDEAKERQQAMEENMEKLLSQRDEGHKLEQALMEENFKKKEEELREKMDELAKANELQRQGSVNIEKFAALELELDRIPALQADVERLQKEVADLNGVIEGLKLENETLADTIESISSAPTTTMGDEGGSAEGGEATSTPAAAGGGGAITMMLKAQMASLKQENAKLYKFKEDVDIIRIERDEMSIEVRTLKHTVESLESTISDLEAAAVERNAKTALPNMMQAAKLRKEREAAQQQSSEQIRFLQDKLDKCKRQLLNLASNVCDYVTSGEEILAKDGVDVEEVEVENATPNLALLISTIGMGNGVEILELSAMMEMEHDAQLILDYVDARVRKGLLTTRNELNTLREVRDNPPSSGGGGPPKLDFMAKQREFRLNKKLKDTETKLAKMKDETAVFKAGLMEQMEQVSERADKSEREYMRVNSINEQLIPQVNAWESLKLEYEQLQISHDELAQQLEEALKELSSRKSELKSMGTDLFKCNIKIKNYGKSQDELEKKLGERTIEGRKYMKEIYGLKTKLQEIEDLEKERLDTNEDVGCQMGAEMTEMSTQTDFVGREVTLRQTNSIVGYPSKMWAKPIVTIGLVNKTIMAERAARTVNVNVSSGAGGGGGGGMGGNGLFLPLLSGSHATGGGGGGAGPETSYLTTRAGMGSRGGGSRSGRRQQGW